MKLSYKIFGACFLCIGVICGVANAYFNVWTNSLWLIYVLILSFALLRRIFWLLLFCTFGFILGNWFVSPISSHIEEVRALYGQEVVLNAVVLDDPNYHKSAQQEFHVGSIELLHPYNGKLTGKIRIRSHQAANVRRGYVINVSGKIYPAKGNRHGTLQYAEIKIINQNTSLTEKFRRQFFSSVHSEIPEPLSSLGLGFLVGASNSLSSELDENLRTVGLTHIVAVSGYNLTVIILIVGRLATNLSKRNYFLSSLILVAIFLSLTGAAASIVRAAVVTTLSLCAWYYGRKINPILLLLASAAISVLISPYYLWLDVGWYLSFTAFFGVLVLAPLVSSRIFKDRQPKLVGQILIETVCAQLATLPVIMYVFGDISVISLFANMLVIPLVPLAMLLVFITGIFSMLNLSLVTIFATGARYLLGYVVKVSEVLSEVSWATTNLRITLFQLIMLYCALVLICIVLAARNSKNRLKNYYL